MKHLMPTAIGTIFIIAMGSLTVVPFHQQTEAGHATDQTCAEAWDAHNIASAWATFACSQAKWDPSWENECRAAGIAVSNAYTYVMAVCH